GDVVTASAEELNALSGLTASSDELNFLDGASVTAGGVVFGNGSNFAQDASNLFWDNTSKRLGIGTASPLATVSVGGDVHISSLSTNGVVTVVGGMLSSKSEGPGGGLNADLVDGLHAFQFLRSDTSDTYTSGMLSFADGTLLDLSAIAHN